MVIVTAQFHNENKNDVAILAAGGTFMKSIFVNTATFASQTMLILISSAGPA